MEVLLFSWLWLYHQNLLTLVVAEIFISYLFAMSNRNWHILSWNIRGINATAKWEAVHDKIEESACAIFCLQETKREHFDMAYIRNFAPKRFDHFDYSPSVGTSGGILVVWNALVFLALWWTSRCLESHWLSPQFTTRKPGA